MKTKITTALFTLATAFGFAQAPPAETIPTIAKLGYAPKPKIEEKVSKTRSFAYLRMGVSDTELKSINLDVLPGLGVGYRLASGASAIDLSASFNRRQIRTDEIKTSTYFYTLPKANYLYYLSPARDSSVYAGGGLAWGGVKTEDRRRFLGLIPNLALGFEMNRNAAWRSFIQLDVSQPAIAAEKRGNLPKPFAEVTLGAGF